jgi:opacity protein-like surface antigen
MHNYYLKQKEKTMKNLITAVALILTASAASAANLPEKKATPTAPAITAPESWYVGVNAGGAINKLDRNVTDNPVTFGGVVGYKWNPMFATEVTVDEQLKKGDQKAQTRVVANGVVSPFGAVFGFTPYALAGVGAQNHDFINNGVKDGTKAIYNVGGGVKYAIAKNWEADARYRWVNTFSDGTKIKDNSVVTLGLNYKF